MKIKKIAIVSKNGIDKGLVKSLSRYEFEYVMKNPDLVVSLGGDGTYLFAERKFPNVQKILVRDESICIKCDVDSFGKAVLEKIKKGEYKIEEKIKLEGIVKRNGRDIFKRLCVNEFVIRNRLPIRALRFSVKIDGKTYENLIGDGVIVATPFGSTAYFYSVTKRKFDSGIGIAFSNVTQKLGPFIVDDGADIIIRIDREEATFSSDNDEKILVLKKNDFVEIRKSKEVAKIVRLV